MRGFDEVSLRLGHTSLDSENRYVQFRQNGPSLREVQGGQGEVAPAAAVSRMLDPRQDPLFQANDRRWERVASICL